MPVLLNRHGTLSLPRPNGASHIWAGHSPGFSDVAPSLPLPHVRPPTHSAAHIPWVDRHLGCGVCYLLERLVTVEFAFHGIHLATALDVRIYVCLHAYANAWPSVLFDLFYHIIFAILGPKRPFWWHAYLRPQRPKTGPNGSQKGKRQASRGARRDKTSPRLPNYAP